MFEWKSAYSVGIDSIDSQHQNLFRLAGELHKAMTTGQGRTVLAQALDRLIQYTKTHFSYEEGLLRQSGYPEFTTHKAAHDALTKQVLKLQADASNGNVSVTIDLLQFLQDWLSKHIQGTDQKYAPYLKERKTA